MRKSTIFILAIVPLLHSSFVYADDSCCCADCVCIPTPGMLGPIGPQGLAGQMGPAGKQGSLGPAGAIGIPGIQGPAGPQGGCCSPSSIFANVFTLTDQVILPNEPILFENVSAQTSFFDLSLTSINGKIIALKSGIYLVSWNFNGQLNNAFTSPVPAWSLGIAQNGNILPSSVSAAFSNTPNNLCIHNSGMSIIPIFFGDVIQLINTSDNSILCVANALGFSFPAASSITLSLISE